MSIPIVVLPVSPVDAGIAAKWLRWVAAFGQSEGVVTCSPGLSPSQLERLRDALPAGWLIVTLGDCAEGTEHGYGHSANLMFRQSLEWCEANAQGRPILWCEPDCIPLAPDWLERIAAEYYAAGKPFMGDFHPHGAIPHMTGNAVYPANWRNLAPSLAALPGKNPGQGWDSACAHETVPQMHKAKTIQQLWRAPKFTATNLHLLRPGAVLFHQCKDGSLIDALCEKHGIAHIPLHREGPEVAWETKCNSPATSVPRQLRMDILIVTCAKDMPFLRYCVASIIRHASGFGEVVLAVPEDERGLYEWVESQGIRIHYYKDAPGKGMLMHEVQICRADEICPHADAVLHVDSDVIFWRRFTPAHYAPGGNPILYREAYAICEPRNPNRALWRECVERAIAIRPEWDFMVRHPACHLIDVFRTTRNEVERHTGRGFDDFMLDGPNAFPQRVAEFPMLGTIAWKYFGDRYIFMDYDHAADIRELRLSNDGFQYVYRRDRDYCAEAWSHGGIDRYRADFEKWKRGDVPKYYLK